MSAEGMEVPSDSLHHHLERVLFDQNRIRERVAEMGREITEDYQGGSLCIVAILQGGVLFLADLVREIRLPLEIDSISVASYHGARRSSGEITFHQHRMPEIEGRDVLVLDDILDSGRTLGAIRDKLDRECRPRTIRSAVLLSKQVARAVEVEADYVGFEVENEFVVGYGLDYRGRYRNLPMIGVLKDEHISD